MSFNPIRTAQGADGYLAFFTDASGLAGDNDLFFNRETHDLTLSSGGKFIFDAGNNDTGLEFHNSGAVRLKFVHDASANQFLFQDNSSLNYFVFNSSGQARIGYAAAESPTATLEVTASTASVKINSTGGDADATLSFQNNGTTEWTMGFDDSNGDFFKIGTTSLTTNTALTIDSFNGYLIGIGTNVPNEKLTVEGVLSLDQQSAPSTTAGYGKVYVKTDGKLYYISPEVSEVELSVEATAIDTVNLHVGGSSSIGGTLTRTIPGIELYSDEDHQTTGDFVPAVKFMTDDPTLSNRPRLAAMIAGKITEGLTSSTDGGMEMVFYTTPNEPGADPLPTERLRIDEDGNVGIGRAGDNMSDDLEVAGTSRFGIDTNGLVLTAGRDNNAAGTSRMRLQSGFGVAAISNDMHGVEIVTDEINTSSLNYFAALKFMASDSSLGSPNPRLLAGIFPVGTESYLSSSDGGIELQFAVTDENPGASSLPTVVMTIEDSGEVTLEEHLVIKEGSAPSSTSGYGKIYVGTDNELHFFDDASNDTQITSAGSVNAGGGGGVTSAQGADGYLAFFTGSDAIAGDNDLWWNRASNGLLIGGGTLASAGKLQLRGDTGGDLMLRMSRASSFDWDFEITGSSDLTMGPAGSTSRLLLDAGAVRVGIGTDTSPTNTLDVAGNMVIGSGYSGSNTASSNSLLVEGTISVGTTSAPGGTGAARFQSSGSGHILELSRGGGYTYFIDIDGNADFDIMENNGTTSVFHIDGGSPYFTGMGTTAPTARLEVHATTAGTDASTGALVLTAESTGGTVAAGFGSSLVFRAETATGGTYAFGSAIEGIWEDPTAGSVDGALSFLTIENSGSFTERMRISADGKVGIGVTPVFPFHSQVTGSDDVNHLVVEATGTGQARVDIRADSDVGISYMRQYGSGHTGDLDGIPVENMSLFIALNASSQTFWSNKNAPMHFLPNEVHAMTISPLQHVGIGTTLPIEPLTVVGPIALSELGSTPATQDGYGKVWVDSAGELNFVDDDGNNVRLTLAGAVDAAGGGGITAAQGSDGYVAFFTGSDGIAGDDNFLWDRVGNFLKVQGTRENSIQVRGDGGGTMVLIGSQTNHPIVGGDTGVIRGPGNRSLAIEVSGNATSDRFMVAVDNALGGGIVDLEAFTVRGDGNVGVHESDPTFPLHVTSTSVDPLNVEGTNALGLRVSGEDNQTVRIIGNIASHAVSGESMGRIIGPGNRGLAIEINGNSSTSDRLVIVTDPSNGGSADTLHTSFFNSGATTFHSSSNTEFTGNVGVGITPTTKLHVDGGGAEVARFVGDGDSGIVVTGDDGTGITIIGNQDSHAVTGVDTGRIIGPGNRALAFELNGNGNTDRFTFITDPGNLGTLTEVLVIQQDGTVGIGVVAPVNKLDVEGAVAIGASYSGTNTAPTNGLLVQGQVGIGNTSPGRPLKVTSPAGSSYVTGIVSEADGAELGLTFLNTNSGYSNPFTSSGAGGFGGDIANADFIGGMTINGTASGGLAVHGTSNGSGSPALTLNANQGVDSTTKAAFYLDAATDSGGSASAIGNSNHVFQLCNNATALLTVLGNGDIQVVNQLGIGNNAPGRPLKVSSPSGSSYVTGILAESDGAEVGFTMFNTNAGYSNPFTTSGAGGFTGDIINADFVGALTINGTTSGGLAVHGASNSSGAPAVQILANQGVESTTKAAIYFDAATDSGAAASAIADANHVFRVCNNSAALFTINGEGLTGIGPDAGSPTATLNVQQDHNDQTLLRIGNTNAESGSRVKLLFDAGGETKASINTAGAANYVDVIANANNGGFFRFWTVTNSSFIPRLHIANSGHIGIGTGFPIEPLTVNGPIALQEQGSTPATEDGYGKLYTDSAGDLKYVDDGGTNNRVAMINSDGYLLPESDNTQSLGNPTNRWESLFLGPESLHFVTTDAQTGIGQDWHMGVGLTEGQGGLQISESNNTKFIITKQGQVGINTNDPTGAQLRVNGRIKCASLRPHGEDATSNVVEFEPDAGNSWFKFRGAAGHAGAIFSAYNTNQFFMEHAVGGVSRLAIHHSTENVTNPDIASATEVLAFLSTGAIKIKESAAPTNISGFGHIYISTSDSDLHFVDDAGTDTNIISLSDVRLKQNVSTIENALEKVMTIRGVHFEWNEEAHRYSNRVEGEKRLGVIAQEVEKVAPEVVNSNREYKSLDYEQLVPLLIEAVKDLKKENDDLKERIEKIEKDKIGVK